MNEKNVSNKQNQMRERERVKRKQIRKRRKALAKRYFILTVILYVFLLLAILFFFSISLKSCEKKEPKNDVVIDKGEKEEKETLKKNELYYDEEFYLPLSAIGKLTDIKVTGDKDNLSFIIECNNEYAKFKIGTTNAQINGNAIELSHKSIMVDGELYLPFDFFTEHMQGITVTVDSKENVYTITASPTLQPQFILKSPAVTDPVEEDKVTDVTDAPIEFKLDLSSYEEYMNPKDKDAYLILVSPDKPMGREEEPTDLTGSIYTRSDRDTRMLRKYACLALEAFLKEGEANGIKGVTVTSAYRSYDYQNQLYQQEITIRGSAEEAAKHVNPPGISEHQTGLAVDMHNMSAASTAFGDTKEAKWLAENAHKFGFILRYPEDKTDITGINYEPWHFRYVGRHHATKMFELDMCLEEYIEYINK